MELLYVVELEVRPTGSALASAQAARTRVLDHVAAWLSHGSTTVLSGNRFTEPGRTVLHSEQADGAEQRVAWTHLGAGEVSALTITARREITSTLIHRGGWGG